MLTIKILIIILVAFILLVLIYLLFSAVTVSIHYRHLNQNDQLTLTIKALNGLLTKKLNIPVIEAHVDSVEVKGYTENDKTGTTKETEDRITPHKIKEYIRKSMKVIRQVHDMKPILKRFGKKIQVIKFRLNTIFGTGEAASAGKLTGIAWSMAGIIQMLLFTFLAVNCRPDITVVPHFNQKILNIELDCIFRFRVGNAILTACKLFFHWRGIKSRLSPFQKTRHTKQSENEIT